MVIFTYLARRFVRYVIVTSFLLAFLFNFIEFFEKLVRVKHTTAATIIAFLRLNFLPSLIDGMPVALWLATCLLLKELMQHNEWELLQIISYVPKRFFVFTITMGLFFGAVVLVVRESAVADLAARAERFKQEKFKQERVQKIIGRWVELSSHQFAYFNVLDLDHMTGLDLLVVTMRPNFELERIVTAPTFVVDPLKCTVLAQQAKVVAMDHPEAVAFDQLNFHTPALLPQLKMSLEAPTLRNLGRKILLYQDVLPIGVYKELLYAFLMRMVCYLQLLLYPVLTYCLFMLTTHAVGRWALALAPYPLFMVLGVVSDAAARYGLNPWLTLVPYAMLITFLLAFWVLMRRRG